MQSTWDARVNNGDPLKWQGARINREFERVNE